MCQTATSFTDEKSSPPNVDGLGFGQELRCLNVTWPLQEVPEEITRLTCSEILPDEPMKRVRTLSVTAVVAAMS